ncbi:MAG: PqqD family protein [Caldilineaceae bacterium]
MNLNTTIARANELMSSPVDDELVLLNLARNNYIGLDSIGRRIWELLATPQRIGDLCSRLGQEFAGEPEQIEADVLAFVDELVGEGLVRVMDE